MSKPLSALTRRRPREQIIAECARGIADEMEHLGFPEHSLLIKLTADDFLRLARVQRELREGAAAIEAMIPEGEA